MSTASSVQQMTLPAWVGAALMIQRHEAVASAVNVQREEIQSLVPGQ
jgi:hypothetical protein